MRIYIYRDRDSNRTANNIRICPSSHVSVFAVRLYMLAGNMLLELVDCFVRSAGASHM